MTLALEDAGLGPADVDVVYASANATPRARRRRSGGASAGSSATRRPVVTSIKGALGEFGASGSAACAAALLCGAAGRCRRLPASRRRPRGADAATWPRATVDAPGPIVLVNSFASGGALFSGVLRVGR